MTGGGSGIGRAAVLAFARAGANVVVADLDAGRCEAVAAEAEAEAQEVGAGLGVGALGVPTDVRSDDDFARLRDATLEAFGRVDVVMNNVGVLAAGLPLNIPIEEWVRILDTNLLSYVRSNLVFLPLLIEQGAGHVVNTASTAGLYPYNYDRMPYGASKGAVVALTESMALYLRPQGVGVTLLCPGPTATNVIEQIAFHGEMGPVKSPDLPIMDAAELGDLVVQAVRDDRFLLIPHGEAVHDILVRKATDPEAFMDAQVAWIQEGQPGSR